MARNPPRPSPKIIVDHHGALTGARSDSDVNPPRTRPGLPCHTGRAHQWMSDQALADRDDLVRSVPAQAGLAVLAHSELDPGAPAEHAILAEFTRPARKLSDGDLAVDSGDPAELLADHPRLEFALRGGAGVLPVAAAAPTGPRVRARCLHAVW